MTAIFLPVIYGGKGTQFGFWTDKSYYFYDSMLVTPFVTGMKTSREDFGKNADELTIYADSGGYQIVTMNKKINPFTILRWQEKVADVGFTLDVPPHYFSKEYSNEQFQKCMLKSNENAELMWRFKQNDDMSLWGVVQGRNVIECKGWYDDLTKEHEFDGYGIALSINAGAKDTIPWLEQLKFVKGIPKRFHFFGWSETLFVVVLAKLSQVMNLDYTYDTSTANIGVRFGKYIDPYTFNHIWFSKKKENRHNVSALPCDCPVCSEHKLKDMYDVPQLIFLHNLYMKLRFCHYVNALVSNDDMFKYLVDNCISLRPAYIKNHSSITSRIMHLIYGEHEPDSIRNGFADEQEDVEEVLTRF